jgi:hypothetical protein
MTSAEFVAGIAAAGALVGSGITGLITYKVVNRQVLSEDRRLREHQLAEVYVDVVRLVHRTMARVENNRPRLKLSPGTPMPPALSFDEEEAIKSRLEAFGSNAMRNIFAEWRGRVSLFVVTVGELDAMAGEGNPRPESVPVDLWVPASREMNELRERLRVLTRCIEQQVREELGTN